MTVRARRRPREETLADFALLSEADRHRPRLIMGHTVFGLHEHVPRHCRYVTMVREVSFADSSLQYCPTCQTGGKPLADRRMSRLLK